MRPGITIRTFIFPEDFPDVHELWANAGDGLHLGRSDTPDEIAKKLQRDPDLFLIAVSADGRLVGAVMGGYDGRRGIVYHLAVAREDRQKGIGRALMEALEERLRSKGCLKAYLLMTKENEAAHFYAENGWQPMDLHIYGKDLS